MELSTMPRRPDEHIDGDEIEMYSMGALAEEASTDIDEHLLICGQCRDHVEEVERYVRAMRDAARTLQSEPRKQAYPWWQLRPVWVGALAVLLLVAVFVFRPHPAATAFALHMTALRGAETSYQAPAETPLVLHPDLTGLSVTGSRLELVDSTGHQLWAGKALPNGAQAPALAEGTYFLRVLSGDGEILREFAIETVKKPGGAAAPR